MAYKVSFRIQTLLHGTRTALRRVEFEQTFKIQGRIMTTCAISNITFNLMKIFSYILLLSSVAAGVFAQSADPKYTVFDGKGNPATLTQIIDAAGKADVVFLGEQHDDATAHAVQLEVFRLAIERFSKQRKVALSLEMFERDVQVILNEYLNGLITEPQFLAGSRPWGNYKTDYRPLVELAKQRKLEVIAANAPRRYVNMVSRLGRDSLNGLSKEAKEWLPPLPYGDPSEAYTKKFNALMGANRDPASATAHFPIVFSQALWDATMAYSIAQSLKKNKNSLVVHLNGGFHTEGRLGTVEHLSKYRSKAKVVVVTMRYEDDFKNFDKAKHTDLGDFVILTDSKVPRTQR